MTNPLPALPVYRASSPARVLRYLTKGFVAILILASALLPKSFAQITFFSGEISGSETWSGVISLSGDVTVTSTGHLTILPGTRIESDLRVDDQTGGAAQNRVEFIVEGVLDAQGTEANPIVFTVFAGNPPTAITAGDWYGIWLKSDQVTMRYCTVEYGTRGISVEQGSPTLEHCTVQNGATGLAIDGGNVTLKQCRVQKNTAGMTIANGVPVTLIECDIVDNNGTGIDQSQTSALNLTKCNILRNVRGLNWGNGLNLAATDTLVSSNREYGLVVSGNLDGTLERCHFDRNVADGIYVTGNMTLTGAVSTVSFNGGNGIYHHQWNSMTLALSDSQVIGNTGEGIHALGLTVQLPIHNSIIASNQVGLSITTQGTKVEGFSGNQLFANRDYEIKNGGPGVIVATNNTFGEPTPSELQAGKLKLTKIYDSYYDPAIGQVIIDRLPSGGATPVAGEISGDTTWSGKILMTGDVTVSGKLTILPGTRIEAIPRADDQIGGAAQNRVEFIVNGILDAQGTEANPIVFTVFAGNPPTAITAGDWYGIWLKSDQVTMRYCTVEYGTRGISVEQGSPTLEHCTVQNGATGLAIDGGNVTLKQCRVQKNTAGMTIANGVPVTLIECDIVDNNGTGIDQSQTSALNLTKCNILRNVRGLNWGNGLNLAATDTLVSSNREYGLVVSGNLDGTLERCHFDRNVADGIYVTGNMTLTGAVSTVSFNGGNGIYHHQWNSMTLALSDSQVIGNTGEGIHALGLTVQLPIHNSIIASNQVGLSITTQGTKVEGFSGNQLFANRDYEIKNGGPGVIVATNNTFGEPTPSELQAGKLKLTKIYDSYYDPAIGQVIIDRLPSGGATPVAGEISGDTTWSGKILMTGDVTVSGKLTILPGTRIEAIPRADDQIGGAAQNRVEFIVNGILDAQGTEANPIVFTVFAGNPPTAITAGDWYGIWLKSDQVTMRYCTVEYGTRGISVEQGSPTLEHCTVQNGSTGLAIDGGNVTLKQCRVQKNTAGMTIVNGVPVTLIECDIVDNNGTGIDQSQTSALNLTKCNILRNVRGLNWGNGLNLAATDTLVSSNREYGLVVSGNLDGTLERCHFDRNVADGIYVTGNMTLTGAVSTVSFNGGNGIYHHQWNSMTLALSDSQVIGNTGEGIHALGLTVQLPIHNSIIASNQVGVWIGTQGASVEGPSVSDLFGNRDYEIRNGGPGPITATNNYWGETTTLELQNRITNLKKIYDSRDDASVGQVIIRTFNPQCFACQSAPLISRQPQSVVATPGQDVVFTVEIAETQTALTYQWQKDRQPIPNKTDSTLTLPKVSATDIGTYRVVVSNGAGLTTTSAEADLSLNSDAEAPSVVSAIGLNGYSIALQFSETLQAGSASTKLKYQADNGQSITDVVVGSDQKTVFLTLSGNPTAALNIDYGGILDLAGNAGSGRVAVLNLTGADLGSPAQPGGATLNVGSALEITAGGADIGGTADSGFFQYESVTGDFDIRVRVTDLDNTDPWAKAGLMARYSSVADSQYYANLVTPAAGKNINFIQYRLAAGQDALFPNELWRPANYPNNWLGLTRSGSKLTASTSTDGQNWLTTHETNIVDLPTTLLVGLATSAHSTTAQTKARYSDLSLQRPVVTGPLLQIANSSGGLTISWPQSSGAFTLQSIVRLGDAAWENITTGISTNAGRISKLIDTADKARFYRLKQ